MIIASNGKSEILPVVFFDITCAIEWSFPRMDQKFSEFSEFRESDKSLKHELDLIYRSSLLPVSHTRDGRFKPF